MLWTLLLVVHVILAIALVVTILLQKSEGGVLGVGGGPTGLMSARGAADFLTRTTTILATAFVATSIALAFVAGANRQADSSVTDILENRPAPAPATSPAPLAPAPTTPALPEVPAAQ